ncbi:MAG: sporulation protein YabP [Actinobacteria bacterium]|nr:sporulation protein YabP [Actinomycetota bacterium]
MDDRTLKNDHRGELQEELHQISIKNREETRIQGVLHVDSFDDQEIVLDTDLGSLVVKGEDLHIKHLDLGSGNCEVEGFVNSLQYSAPNRNKPGAKGRSKGIFERLLR